MQYRAFEKKHRMRTLSSLKDNSHILHHTLIQEAHVPTGVVVPDQDHILVALTLGLRSQDQDVYA